MEVMLEKSDWAPAEIRTVEWPEAHRYVYSGGHVREYDDTQETIIVVSREYPVLNVHNTWYVLVREDEEEWQCRVHLSAVFEGETWFTVIESGRMTRVTDDNRQTIHRRHKATDWRTSD